MKAPLFVSLAVMLFFALPIFGNGVLVTGELNNQYYTLVGSEVSVEVEDQVAIVTSSQLFMNSFQANTPKYVFPLPEGASATQLRWLQDEEWNIANFAPVVQDSLPPNPSHGWPYILQTYMGDNPLFFNLPDPVAAEHTVLVELTYVMLLPYDQGSVSFHYKNNYQLLQSTLLEQISFDFTLISQRTIVGIDLVGLNGEISNDGHNAQVSYTTSNQINIADFKVNYSLDPEQFGLFSMSTKLDEVPDEHPEGFFLFIAEPDASDNEVVIDKTFTFIIDRSGSMGGNKMVQAKNAANYIVDHLNSNDMFNIVSFSSDASAYLTEHTIASPTNRAAAHNYINSLVASGMTNVSAAFDLAIPQFMNANPNNASIIIFFTDGQANQGVYQTQALVQHVSNLINQYEVNLNLFNFGIGQDVNEQLLTLLALDNNGIAQFLGDNDLETQITAFYNIIANPVLINPQITFGAAAGISEVYPNPLPNVYKGYQMLVSGRYLNGGNTDISFTGQAFNNVVTYDYDMELANSLVTEKQFLTKIWAKMKIAYLMGMYYSHPEHSAEAEAYRLQIIEISLAYGVMSPFTSFTGDDPDDPGDDDDPWSNEDDVASPDASPAYILRGNYPNPFNPSTAIRFAVTNSAKRLVKVKIYNLRGQVIRTLALNVDGKGEYEVYWDGTDMQGKLQPSAVYFYIIDFGDAQLSGKMVMSK